MRTFCLISQFNVQELSFLNHIPTGNGLNQHKYSYHVTQAGRNRVKDVFIEGIDDLQASAQAFLDLPDNVFW